MRTVSLEESVARAWLALTLRASPGRVGGRAIWRLAGRIDGVSAAAFGPPVRNVWLG